MNVPKNTERLSTATPTTPLKGDELIEVLKAISQKVSLPAVTVATLFAIQQHYLQMKTIEHHWESLSLRDLQGEGSQEIVQYLLTQLPPDTKLKDVIDRTENKPEKLTPNPKWIIDLMNGRETNEAEKKIFNFKTGEKATHIKIHSVDNNTQLVTLAVTFEMDFLQTPNKEMLGKELADCANSVILYESPLRLSSTSASRFQFTGRIEDGCIVFFLTVGPVFLLILQITSQYGVHDRITSLFWSAGWGMTVGSLITCGYIALAPVTVPATMAAVMVGGLGGGFFTGGLVHTLHVNNII